MIGDVPAGGGEQFERRERVAGRASSLLERGVDHRRVDLDARVLGNPLEVLGEGVRREQVELEVLVSLQVLFKQA
ncbi:MAG: hypothetical protein VW708_07430, partial [Ilumatobacter sp.]